MFFFSLNRYVDYPTEGKSYKENQRMTTELNERLKDDPSKLNTKTFYKVS